MARMIKQFRAGDIDIWVQYDSVYSEYIVRMFRNGVENRDAKYYTDDREDAIGTARLIFKSFVIGD